MATVRYLRKLPQRTGLSGMATRTPLEVKISDRVSYIPPRETPASGLNALAEEPRPKRLNPVLSTFSQLGQAGGAGALGETGTEAIGSANPFGSAGQAISSQIGENIGSSMVGRGITSAAKTGITAKALGLPTSIAVPSSLQAAIMAAMSPIGLANIGIGQAISGQTALGAVQGSPSLSGVEAQNAALAALANSPQTALGHLGALVGIGTPASEASQAAVSAAEQGAASLTGVSQGSEDPVAQGMLGSNPAALSSAVAASLAGSPDVGANVSGVAQGIAEGMIGGFGAAAGGAAGGAGGASGPAGSGSSSPGGPSSGAGLAGAEGPGGGGGAGGTVICTELHRQGFMPDCIYEADCRYGSRLPYEVLQGYYWFGRPLARVMRRSRIVTALVKPLALKWAFNMAAKEGYGKGNRTGAFLEWIGIPLCREIFKVRQALSQEISSSQEGSFS